MTATGAGGATSVAAGIGAWLSVLVGALAGSTLGVRAAGVGTGAGVRALEGGADTGVGVSLTT